MLYLATASLLWAFSFGLIKGHLTTLDPLLVAFWRLAIAGVAFLPFALRRRPAWAEVGRLAAIGALQFGLMYGLYIAAYRYLPAYGVAFWTVVTPLYVVLMSGGWRPRPLMAALVAVAAAVAVLVEGSPLGSVAGILLVQGSNLCFAAGQVLYRRFGPAASVASEAGQLGWMYLGAAALAGAALLLPGDRGAHMVAPDQWRVLLYLGLAPTAVGFALWNLGARRAKSGILAVANNLKVPLAVVVSWLVFGEAADHLRTALGLVLMAAALALAGRRAKESSCST